MTEGLSDKYTVTVTVTVAESVKAESRRACSPHLERAAKVSISNLHTPAEDDVVHSVGIGSGKTYKVSSRTC